MTLHSLLRSQTPRALAVALAGMHALGCGDDEQASGPVRPPGPPALTIDGLHSAGAGRWQPGDPSSCVDLGRDPGGTIAIELGRRTGDGLRLVNWTLRTFGGCAGAVQCGPAVITVTQGETIVQVVGVSVSVDVPFRDLGLGAGPTTFEVELVNDDGTPYVLDGGTPARDEVTVEVAERCIPVPDAGARDGGGDAMVRDAATGDARDAATDAGLSDAAVRDALPADANAETDADAAEAFDASTPLDASVSGDAGPRDASSDAPTGG